MGSNKISLFMSYDVKINHVNQAVDKTKESSNGLARWAPRTTAALPTPSGLGMQTAIQSHLMHACNDIKVALDAAKFDMIGT